MKKQMSFTLVMALIAVIGLACISTNNAQAAQPSTVSADPLAGSIAVLVDTDKKGNGYIVSTLAGGFSVTINDTAPLKISVPYKGSKSDSGFVSAQKGMTLVARAAWEEGNEKKVIESDPVKIDSTTTSVTFVFHSNPSQDESPVYMVVDLGSLDGKKSQWLCPPWTSIVSFARDASNHPKGIHCIAFMLEGEQVRDAIDQAKEYGWTPSLPYHSQKGDVTK
jgi:hypothetical protein